MSTYLASDIHGDKIAFEKLLQCVDFQKDKLYLLGDVLDRGDHGIDILIKVKKLIKEYPGQMVLLKGNHELFMEMYFDGSLSESTWSSKVYGGAPTLKAIEKMNKRDLTRLVNFVKSLPIYAEIDSPMFGKTILTHAGLLDFFAPSSTYKKGIINCLVKNSDGTINVVESIKRGYSLSPFDFLCSDTIHHISTTGLDRFMILGHVPTIFLDNRSHEIFKGKRYMVIDSGNAYRAQGGKQSLYCVERDEALYI